MVDLVERINVLLEQEYFSYATEDYLDPQFQHNLIDVDLGNIGRRRAGSGCSKESRGSTSTSGINEVWREKICEWCYQVIDHYGFSREVVGIALSYLDRFLCRRSVNKKHFQLLAMTCLYLAIKVYEPGTISMKTVIELSRGFFVVGQMVEMEMAVLRALSWKVHPPTAYCFAKHVLFLLPQTSIDLDARHDLLELTRFLTELSVIDYFFVGRRASSVALAALLNAMEQLDGIPGAASSELIRELRRIPLLDPTREDVLECRERLTILYIQGGYGDAQPHVVHADDRTETISPVCVSHDVYQQAIEYK